MRAEPSQGLELPSARPAASTAIASNIEPALAGSASTLSTVAPLDSSSTPPTVSRLVRSAAPAHAARSAPTLRFDAAAQVPIGASADGALMGISEVPPY
jgi:hypothetical protein